MRYINRRFTLHYNGTSQFMVYAVALSISGLSSLQCSDSVSLVTGKASGFQKSVPHMLSSISKIVKYVISLAEA